MSHIVNLAQGEFLKALDKAITDCEESEAGILNSLAVEVPEASSQEAVTFTFPAGAILLKVRAFITKVCVFLLLLSMSRNVLLFSGTTSGTCQEIPP